MTASRIAAILVAALGILAGTTRAERVTIDFDGVNTSSGYATGAAVRDYLAGFGVTTPNNPTVLDTTFYAIYIASPTRNIVSGGDGRNPTILTFEFATPVSEFSFVRAGIVGANSPSGTIAGDWTATAYDAAGLPIASVGEPLVAFYGDRPQLVFLLKALTPGPGTAIHKVVFAGYDHGFAGINVPHITNLSFVTEAPEESPCGVQAINNVRLPGVDLPFNFLVKTWQVSYLDLGIDFAVSEGTTPDVQCVAQSNTGTLQVRIRFLTEAGFVPVTAHSTTSATVKLRTRDAAFPGGPPLQCAFDLIGAVRNRCIVNGAFRSGAQYLEWSSPGFLTEVLGVEPKFLATGPLTYYVDVDAIPGLGAGADFETLLRTAETYLHTTLIANLPVVTRYAIVQDPGNVRLLVHGPDGRTAGVDASGMVVSDIPNSFVGSTEGNPAIVMAEFEPGDYLVELVATGDGPYLLAVQTANLATGAPGESIVSGTALAGMSLAFSARLGEAGMDRPLTPQPGASLAMLRRYVDEQLRGEPGNSLSAKLREASAALARGSRDADAVFRPFLNEVAAQRGKKITYAAADLLTVWANAIADQVSRS